MANKKRFVSKRRSAIQRELKKLKLKNTLSLPFLKLVSSQKKRVQQIQSLKRKIGQRGNVQKRLARGTQNQGT